MFLLRLLRLLPLQRLPILLLLLLLLVTGIALAQQPVPVLNTRVTDLTGTLNAAEQTELEQRLAQLETAKGSQIAVLIVASTQPETIEQYALKVAETWRLGRAGADDGVLLLVAKDDRKLRIEVGYGLEGALPDATANRIIEEFIVPGFKQGQFYAGIQAGVERIIGVIEGEPLPAPASGWSRSSDGGMEAFAGLLPLAFFAIPILPVLGKTFGRLPVAIASSALMGGAGYLLSGIIAALVLAAFAFFIALNARTTMQPATGTRTGGYRHGPVVYPGGYGRRSGGGGGFSGGGGGFGGGGASGNW